ncbi:MAG: DsbC family protein [Bacterioplanes sp.]|nr:DsbC family protein [Bacterioplanes sp.]
MKKSLLALLCGMGCMAAVQANDAQGIDSVALKSTIETRLIQAFGPRLKVTSVTPLANQQILEVVLIDGSIMHMTPDATHFIYRDELYALADSGPTNVTQSRLNPIRADRMASIADAQTVVFKAKGDEKSVIHVFTDIDCGFCQKFHDEVPRLNELGITVRYLAYPRAGVTHPQTGALTDSYRKINYVWCEGDKQDAMTTMKNSQRELGTLGQRLRQGQNQVQAQYRAVEADIASMMNKSKDCGAPIAAHLQVGQEIGVTGTPAIITQQGDLIPGYMPADDLARRIGL